MTTSTESAPTSRSSTTDLPQLGPIALFEHHLKFLSDSYLSFFQERAKIEESYIDALFRLHKKTKSIDNQLDERTEPTTMRKAWNEVRDSLEREAQSRSAFLSALSVDVINPISSFKETQDRTRKRIKEDIRESTSAHQDYAENTLPRLKRAYTKKCQEFEDYKASAITSLPNGPISQDLAALSLSRPNPSTAPVVTSPQPLRPLSRRASGHHPQPRNRSPSTTNPLQDLAHQGKRQLNSLMTFLDNKGGNVKDGLGVGRGDGAVRTVKAKREADEADKEYRKGVHWLETLRLRRIKIMEGAFKSLELFIDESSQRMKSVLEKYIENSIATSTTHTHLFEHARSIANSISPKQDIIGLSSVMPRYMQVATPKRVLYTNYYVGDCNDLIFGVGLVDYATSRGLHDGELPKIVRICIGEVDRRGLQSEGIYRVSGRHAAVQEIIHKIEKDERNFQFNPNTDDVFVIASLLKQYLRELPEPLFKFPLEDRVKHTEELGEHVQNDFLFLRGKMRRLPAVHQTTLKAIVEHLSRVAAASEKNKMDAKNLAIIFSGVVFGEDDIPKQVDLLSIQNWKDSLMEDLITYANVLFDERSAGQPSHPLPPAPFNEPAASVGYGSQYTQVSTVPAKAQKSETQGTQDFTPQLPARPGNSIHPSRRAVNQSSRSLESEDSDSIDIEPCSAISETASIPIDISVDPTYSTRTPTSLEFSSEPTFRTASPRLTDTRELRRSSESQRSNRGFATPRLPSEEQLQ